MQGYETVHDEGHCPASHAPMSHSGTRECNTYIDRSKVAAGLKFALILYCFQVVFQIACAIGSNSMALIADTIQMIIDMATFALNLMANNAAMEPFSARLSGSNVLTKTEIAAAGASAFTVVVASIPMIFAAISSLDSPQHEIIHSREMLAGALTGLLCDAVILFLFKGTFDNMNARSAILHVVVDLGRGLVVIIASVAIGMGAHGEVDAVATLCLALLSAAAACQLMWKSYTATKRTDFVQIE